MNNEVIKKEYKELRPFKIWALENFPFIESDFDSLTNYELLCKIVEYLNNVIYNQNQVQDLSNELVDAYNTLLEYVNNYLTDENLQPLINNKLDDMVEDGTMAQIINQEIFTDLNNRVNILNNQINNKKYLFIGDSYLAGWSPDGTYTNWGEICADNLGLTSSQYIIKSKGGIGFVNGDGFISLLNQVPNDTSITDVVVCGGYNDRQKTTEQITNAIATFKTRMLEKFPNAKLSIGCIGWSSDPEKIYTNSNLVRKYIDSTEVNGCKYLHNVEYILHDYYNCWSSDLYHPNQYGHTLLGKGIAEALVNGSCDVYMQTSDYLQNYLTFTSDFDTTSSTSFQIMGINNNITYMLFEALHLKCPNGITLNHNWKDIGSFKSGFIVGASNDFLSFNKQCVLQAVSDSQYYSRNLDFKIRAGHLYVRMESTANYSTTSNGYESLSVKDIEVPPITITFPSIMC